MKNEDNIFDSELESKEVFLDEKPLKVTEEKPAGFNRYRLKLLGLAAIITLSVGLQFATHLSKSGEPTKNTSSQEQVETIGLADKEQENNKYSFYIGDIIVEVIDPEINLEEDSTYKIPEGYNYDGYNCYRLSCPGDAPEGYVKGADNKTLYQVDSEIKYQVEEGCILVGDKSLEIHNAIETEINGEKSYSAPSGYWKAGKKYFRVTDAIPLTDEYGNWININEETEPIVINHDDGTYSYGAPEGYYYINDTCYKIEVPEQTKGR